ncbi:HAD family hydrolase [Nocardioides panacisoli]|uniref:HAD family hydrolase n=1 Tax=Nocardioides panacisoli TaxID=627624 RepID=UPI001C627CB2|nr:HAD family hydrolase [Nocardioides panacisoli]QYJ05452.1 HAD family hydrolase [Nocardioides panacisoli]
MTLTDADLAVLLDVDGTLIDSTYHHALAWQRAFTRHTTPPPMARLHRAIGMGGDKLVAHVTSQQTEDRLGDQLRADWREEYLQLRGEVAALPGAATMVAEIADAGHRVAVASSGDPQFAQDAVDFLRIGDHLELVLSSADVDASKPEPDLVGEALARLGHPAYAVMVGDTVYDVEAARRADIPCVALLSGGFGLDELEEAGAACIVEHPVDLCGVDWWDVARS